MLLPLVHIFNLVKTRNFSASRLCEINYFYVRNAFVFSFLFSLARDFFGTSIICETRDVSARVDLVETYCFVNGTVTHSSEDPSILFHHNYYQWVSVLFLLNAFVYHFPYHVWLKYFKDHVPVCDKHFEFQDVFDYIASSDCCLFWKTFCLEIVYLAINVCQPFVLDLVFNGYLLDPTVSLDDIFPIRSTKCHFHYFSLGNEAQASVRCLLPLNVIYLKIFQALFVAYWVVLAAHAASLVYRALLVAGHLRRGPFERDLNKWWLYKIAARNIHGLDLWRKMNCSGSVRDTEIPLGVSRS